MGVLYYLSSMFIRVSVVKKRHWVDESQFGASHFTGYEKARLKTLESLGLGFQASIN